ncbi:hypothetical protein X943_001639 [Babesia divergens]|uniref:Uncharacterized protein n=1 Tax=Babesia divergens TaxID=32595 RepID=A0AAD9GAH5_BABDI|nr:hypothetical protein X943_001639 [Babesia divergens]
MSGSLPKLLAVISRVKDAAESFRNPMFRHYFARKASEELNLLQQTGGSLSCSEIDQRLKINEELEEQLRRQCHIQNLYYDEQPVVEK